MDSNFKEHEFINNIFRTACKYENIRILKDLLCILSPSISKDMILLEFKRSNLRTKRYLYEYNHNKNLKLNLLSTVINKKDIDYIKNIRIYSNQYNDIIILCI